MAFAFAYRGTMTAAVVAAALMWPAFGLQAEAAPIKKVLSACDKTSGCNYTINDKNGDISGCSRQSGTCFYCPNDGKRQCFAVRQVPPPGKKPVLLNQDIMLTK